MIACHDGAGLDDPEVPSGSPSILHPACHVRHIEAYIQFPARLAALTDLDQYGTDAPAVAKAKTGLADAVDHKVLAEGARSEAIGTRRYLPGPSREVRCRIGVNGLMWTAMVLAISLLVAFAA